MAEQQDDWVQVHLPGGPSVPVRRGSPAEAVFSGRPNAPTPAWRMQWSTGFLGDFLWMTLPECRPIFADRIKAELEDAIDLGRELQPIGPLDIACDVLWYPLVRPALNADPMDEEWVTRLLRVVREAFELEPPPWEDTRYGLRVYVLENLDVPEYIATVKRLDPALFALIRG